MPEAVADARTTIVMATRNRRDQALRTLVRLRSLPTRPPIIVVDDASSDGTAAAVEECFPEVTALHSPQNLAAAARNLGVEAATTPYVAFADDDSWYAPDALGRAAALLDTHPDVALVAAAIVIEPDGRPDPTNALMSASPLGHHGLPGPEVLGFIACGAVVRRDAFLAAGGFDQRLQIGGEEELLALDLRAAGWRSVYVEAVRAHHAPAADGLRPGRRRIMTRNRLWVAWLRRSPANVARIFRSAARHAMRDADARAGLIEAIRGLPKLRGSRHRLPASVEADVMRVERAG